MAQNLSYTGRTVVAAAVAAALLAGCAAPAALAAAPPDEPTGAIALALPSPTVSQPIGTVELHLVDSARPGSEGRPRELMVSIWYPAAPDPGAATAPYLAPSVAAHYAKLTGSLGVPPGTADYAGITTHAVLDAPVAPGATDRPVLLYSPGGGHSRAMGTTLVEELAAHGFVVITIDHPGGGPIAYPDRTDLPGRPGDLAQMLRDRVGDARYVLDHLAQIRTGPHQPDLPAGLPAAVDLDRVGMFGHSAGGFTAAEALIDDDRIDAGANLDGSMDPDYGQAATQGADRPFLLMGGGTSGDDAHPHNHHHAPDWQAFWQHSTGVKHDVYLPAAEHMSFSDQQVLLPQIDAAHPLSDEVMTRLIGTVDPDRSLAAQRAYLLAFFDEHLRGRPSALFDGDQAAHPDVQVVP